MTSSPFINADMLRIGAKSCRLRAFLVNDIIPQLEEVRPPFPGQAKSGLLNPSGSFCQRPAPAPWSYQYHRAKRLACQAEHFGRSVATQDALPADNNGSLEEKRQQDEQWSASAGLPASVELSGTDWGATVLTATQDVLEQPVMHGLALYSLRALQRGKRVLIALDKLDNEYGSPSLEDMEAFQHALGLKLEAALGSEAAGELEVEVSSPGAERSVNFPHDLPRFAGLPMKVKFAMEDNSTTTKKLQSMILKFKSKDDAAECTQWQLANVRANRVKGKGSILTKKQQQQQFAILFRNLLEVNLHLDV